MTEWNPMSTFPKDGTKCDIIFQHKKIGKGFFWGRDLMGKGYCIRGETNTMSHWLNPEGWRKSEQKEVKE